MTRPKGIEGSTPPESLKEHEGLRQALPEPDQLLEEPKKIDLEELKKELLELDSWDADFDYSAKNNEVIYKIDGFINQYNLSRENVREILKALDLMHYLEAYAKYFSPEEMEKMVLDWVQRFTTTGRSYPVIFLSRYYFPYIKQGEQRKIVETQLQSGEDFDVFLSTPQALISGLGEEEGKKKLDEIVRNFLNSPDWRKLIQASTLDYLSYYSQTDADEIIKAALLKEKLDPFIFLLIPFPDCMGMFQRKF